MGFHFGTGHGGAALSGVQGFALRSDYDRGTGGANPILGLASGAGYGAMDVALGERLTLPTSMSRRDAERDLRFAGVDEVAALGGIGPYRATATTVTARYKAKSWLAASVGYTLLDKQSGLSSTQSIDRHDFAGGTTTDSGTLGVDATVTPSLLVTASATFGRTREGGRNIAAGDGGVVSSAYQLAVTKVGLFGGNDRARLTVSQPFHVERGSVDIANIQVIDRQTGELGNVVRSFDISNRQRRFVAEALYRTSVMDGVADVNLFGRANLERDVGSMPTLVVGGSFRLGF